MSLSGQFTRALVVGLDAFIVPRVSLRLSASVAKGRQAVLPRSRTRLALSTAKIPRDSEPVLPGCSAPTNGSLWPGRIAVTADLFHSVCVQVLLTLSTRDVPRRAASRYFEASGFRFKYLKKGGARTLNARVGKPKRSDPRKPALIQHKNMPITSLRKLFASLVHASLLANLRPAY